MSLLATWKGNPPTLIVYNQVHHPPGATGLFRSEMYAQEE